MILTSAPTPRAGRLPLPPEPAPLSLTLVWCRIVSGPRRDYDSGAYAPRPEHDYLSSLRADVPPPPNHSSVLELTREGESKLSPLVEPSALTPAGCADLELSMPVVAQSRTAPTMAAPARSVPHVLAGLNQRVMDLAQRMARLDVTQSHLRETAGASLCLLACL